MCAKVVVSAMVVMAVTASVVALAVTLAVVVVVASTSTRLPSHSRSFGGGNRGGGASAPWGCRRGAGWGRREGGKKDLCGSATTYTVSTLRAGSWASCVQIPLLFLFCFCLGVKGVCTLCAGWAGGGEVVVGAGPCLCAGRLGWWWVQALTQQRRLWYFSRALWSKSPEYLWLSST